LATAAARVLISQPINFDNTLLVNGYSNLKCSPKIRPVAKVERALE